jgi:hypothetical protein
MADDRFDRLHPTEVDTIIPLAEDRPATGSFLCSLEDHGNHVGSRFG